MKALSVPASVAIGAAAFASWPLQSSAIDPTALLKASMDRYHSMRSLKAAWTWSVKGTDKSMPWATMAIQKTLEYAAPNCFVLKEDAQAQGSLQVTSDGKQVLFVSSSDPKSGIADKAPESMDTMNSPLLSKTVLSSLLFQFMGGAANYDQLVDAGKGVTLGGEETAPDGQKAVHVKFVSKGVYGKTDVLIGENSKLVYEINFDLKAGPAAAGGDSAPHAEGSELFTRIEPDATVAQADFSTDPPKGMKVQSFAELMAQQEQAADKPPFPIGSKAPDFKVYSLKDGQPMKLSSLKGQVVMIDFWATWCPPCRESLPHTEDVFKTYGAHNVKVVTISDEDAKTIRDFVDDNKYTFPTFRDPSSATEKLYGVTAIPTVVVIDAQGNLAAYMVGLRPEEEVVSALKKAGAS